MFRMYHYYSMVFNTLQYRNQSIVSTQWIQKQDFQALNHGAKFHIHECILRRLKYL